MMKIITGKVSPEALAKLKKAEVHGTTTSNKQTAQ